jgi:uncharacterized protein
MMRGLYVSMRSGGVSGMKCSHELPDTKGEITPEQTAELLQEFRVPNHIIAHSKKVAEVACFLASELNKVGYALELSLVEVGALLHDIARIHSIETGDDHTSVGGTWLKEKGFDRVADIVRHHVHFPDEEMRISEVAVVNYADKRVMETTIVDLNERFEDFIQRHGVTGKELERLDEFRERIKKLEHILFFPLPFGPEELVMRIEGERPV